MSFFPNGGYPYFLADTWNPWQAIQQATGVPVSSGNPAYLIADFQAWYPQFVGIVNDVVVQNYINIATNCLNSMVWGIEWTEAMANFVAHNVVLYLRMLGVPGAPAQAIVQQSLAIGVLTSKSVDSVSSGYDTNLVGDDLKGFGDYKLTIFGQKLATRAKIIGMSGMGIW